MASITIRNLDDDIEEVRVILRDAVTGRETGPRNLARFTRECFASLGGVELELPPRGPIRDLM